MLDVNVDKLLSIEASISEKKDLKTKALIIKECRLDLFGNGRIYSEFEEQTFNTLNSNKGLGVLDVQFTFLNCSLKKAYPRFYTKCFVIRTNNRFHIKPMKYSDIPSSSKVDLEGNIVVGVRYYFRTEREKEAITECNELLIEGFIAFEKPKNVYGVMCQLMKQEAGWKIVEAYTYKPENVKNIKYLID